MSKLLVTLPVQPHSVPRMKMGFVELLSSSEQERAEILALMSKEKIHLIMERGTVKREGDLSYLDKFSCGCGDMDGLKVTMWVYRSLFGCESSRVELGDGENGNGNRLSSKLCRCCCCCWGDELADDVCVLTIQQELTVVIYEPYL